MNKSILLLYFQTIKGFKFNNFLERFGLPYNVEIIFKDLLIKKLVGVEINIDGKKIKITKKFINNNINELNSKMSIFIQFVLDLESNGGNINASNPKSTARKAFQFINGFKDNGEAIKRNGKIYYDRNKGNYSPFDTALRRSCLYFTGLKIPDFNNEKCPKFIKDAWNKNSIHGLIDMGLENETIVWLIDLFLKENSEKYIGGTILGNSWYMRRLYEDFHHTTSKGNFTNSTTEKLINENMLYYGEKIANIK